MVPLDKEETLAADCCRPPDPRIARVFDERAGAWADTDDFPEMVDVSARLLDQLRDDVGARHPTILELGCGTGALGVALLELGASRFMGVDLSATSIEVAKRRAGAAGFAEQTAFVVGDAASVPLHRHDWVILDRAICCFRHVERLVGGAIEAGINRIAISVPESRGWRGLINHPLWRLENVWDLLHGGCRGYVHNLRRLERQLAQAGFRPLAGRSGHIGLWFVGVYERF